MPAVAAAPGIVFQFADPPRSEPDLRTDIAGFVGIAERGPFHRAVRLESWHQYESTFGGFGAPGFLALAVYAFFANGGRTCYVVRVLDPDTARHASAELPLGDGSGAGTSILRVIATSPGSWANGISLEFRPLPGGAQARFTLVVRSPEGPMWRLADCTLGRDDARSLHRVMHATAGLPVRLSSLHTGAPNEEGALRSPAPEELDQVPVLPLREVDSPGAVAVTLGQGADGLATLGVDHLCGRDSAIDESNRWGLWALFDIDDVSIVAMPDASAFPRDAKPAARPLPEPGCEVRCWTAPPASRPWPPQTTEMAPAWSEAETRDCADRAIRFCKLRRDCVALLDTPPVLTTPEHVIAYREPFDTSFAALYWPWVLVPRRPRELRSHFTANPHRDFGRLAAPVPDLGADRPLYMPPSGMVAGLTAAADLLVGPHRTPAGQTALGAIRARTAVNDDEHGSLNSRGINVLRERVGRGVVLEGARTLDARQRPGWPWRHLNVRRVLIAIAEFLDERCQDTVFEANNERLWADLKDLIRSFLMNRWRRGWLSGARPDEAFSVKCDADTNPEESVSLGQVVAVIGLRFPPPIEWIVVRIGRTAAGVEVLDVDRA